MVLLIYRRARFGGSEIRAGCIENIGPSVIVCQIDVLWIRVLSDIHLVGKTNVNLKRREKFNGRCFKHSVKMVRV